MTRKHSHFCSATHKKTNVDLYLMYNTKNYGGTFKGVIGECMVKLTDAQLVLTRFYPRNKFFMLFGTRFTPEQQMFLTQNWYSLDAVKAVPGKAPILFEIKTRNYYANPNPAWVNSMTQNTTVLYEQAAKLGFITKVLTVWLHDNWEFRIDEENFQNAVYYVTEPKKYDAGFPLQQVATNPVGHNQSTMALPMPKK